MPKTTALATALLDHIFLNAALANIGDAAGLLPAGTVGSFYLSLHTGSPGVGGDQTTSEAAYTGYTRVVVARDGGHWTITGNVASNVLAVVFPQSSTGPETETYVGVGSAATLAGHLFFYGVLTAPVVVNNLITPEFLAGQITFTET